MRLEIDRLLVGEKYINASKILLEGMIEDRNLVISDHEISNKEYENRSKMCAFNVILPCFFCLYQGIELIIKGFVSFKLGDVRVRHDMETLCQKFADNYVKQKKLYELLMRFITNPVNVIVEYNKMNSIEKTADFYNSLRYPDNISNTNHYDYSLLLHPMNDNIFVSQMKKLLKDINNFMRLSNALLAQLNNQ